MNKRRILITVLSSSFLLCVILYSYLIILDPLLNIGVGYNHQEHDVTIDIRNNSVFPILISDVEVLNENNQDIRGDIYEIQLKNIQRINIQRDDLSSPEIEKHVSSFEPFDALFIKGKDDQNSYIIYIEKAKFESISKVILKTKVLGIFPYKHSKDFQEDISL